MAATLLGALTTTFQGDTALAAAMPGSPWLDEPIEGTAFPYAVIENLREKEDVLALEQEKQILSSWDFLLYGVGEAAMEAHALTIRALLDGVSDTTTLSLLRISRRNLIRCTQVGYQVRLDQTRSAEGRRVTEVRMSFYAEWEYA